MNTNEKKKSMTVAEAGRLGGRAARDRLGHEFYVEIGHKGGSKVRRLVEAGKKALGEDTGPPTLSYAEACLVTLGHAHYAIKSLKARLHLNHSEALRMIASHKGGR